MEKEESLNSKAQKVSCHEISLSGLSLQKAYKVKPTSEKKKEKKIKKWI